LGSIHRDRIISVDASETIPAVTAAIGSPSAYILSASKIYGGVLMTKRLIDIEDSLLEQARTALRTDTIKETVITALQQAVQSSRRREDVDEAALQCFAAAATDLGNPEVMAAAWR
jgi:Arc/MetJ family transcription regulator